jgi:arylsulfatase A-like enzyme
VVTKYAAKLAKLSKDQPDFEDGRDGRVRVRQSHPTYAAMIESLDNSVGRVLQHLKERGLTDDTIVIFTSDNGGVATAEGWPTSNRPLRTGKGWDYDGGVREPLLVSWPGHIAPGRTTDAIVTSPDFFPTLLALSGLPERPKLHVDGVSFAPTLLDPSVQAPERAIYWHYPHYSNQRGTPNGAVRQGRWKLVEWYEDGRTELFDLSTDISENDDVSGGHPEIVRELLGKLHAWRENVSARMPTQNPNYRSK